MVGKEADRCGCGFGGSLQGLLTVIASMETNRKGSGAKILTAGIELHQVTKGCNRTASSVTGFV